VQGTDGNFYGTTAGSTDTGGYVSYGTIFKITPQGTLTTLHTFCSSSGCSDGEAPIAGLIEGSDGNYYGTTTEGGVVNQSSVPYGNGTLFRVNPSGALTSYQLCSQSNCTSGYSPASALYLAGNGTFYGTTQEGGSNNQGTVFEITGTGTLNTLYSFCVQDDCATGGTPQASLIQGTDGNLYSTTYGGGVNAVSPQCPDPYFCGTIFKIAVSPALPAPVQLTLSSNAVNVGSKVTADFSVSNAFSLTMQQCYAYATLNGTTTALGRVAGSYNPTTKLYTGTANFTPAAGSYVVALTCGGVESGVASLVATYATTTTVTALPNPVTPPGNVALTATIARTGGTGTPGGTVTFYYQTTALGSATVGSNGLAELGRSTYGLPAGQYAITARYSGDSIDAASTSAPVTVTVD
jgi:uncharacterized repeat protein (TIGR03803 family)